MLPDANGTKKPPKQDKEIATFEKNAVEEVRVKLVEWKCQDYIDIRVWFNSNGKSVMPTKKGITLNVELVPKLIDALKKAALALKEAEDKT